MGDPLDVVTALGVRIVFVPDFDDQVVLVQEVGVVLVDPACSRKAVADVALDLIADVPTD